MHSEFFQMLQQYKEIHPEHFSDLSFTDFENYCQSTEGKKEIKYGSNCIMQYSSHDFGCHCI